MGFSDLPTFGEYQHEVTQKRPRGSHILDRDAKRKAIKANEDAVKAEAKSRDGHRCRWPEKHVCRGNLEGAHMVAKGMGGDPKARVTTRDGIVTLCAWIHRMGPETLEHHELAIEAETRYGTDGPLSFWRCPVNQPRHMVARETSIGLLERD